jgi:hypothetical protein
MSNIKEVVILTDRGILTSAIPLFAKYHDTELDTLDGYSISLSNDKALAYVVYVGEGENLQLVNGELLEKHCEVLGYL